MDQVGRVAQESVRGIEQIPCNLLHPIPVGSDADSSDLHGAGLELDDEEHHVADRPEHAKSLDVDQKSHAYSVSQWLLRNCCQVRLWLRSGAGSTPASARMFATVVQPMSIFNPRRASRIRV